jgi:DNA-3-methyladenine glycosylase II
MKSAALRVFRKSDPILAEHVRTCRIKYFSPSPPPTPFEALARSICYQQLHGKAAQTIWNRVVEAAGGPNRFSAKRVAALSDETLRAAGLSRNKMLAFQSLAEAAAGNRKFNWSSFSEMEDDELIELLTEIRGIGVWTVQMLLIFSLGRPDVLPIDDFGVRKGYALLYKAKEHPTPRELRAIGERWRPYRSVASWYLWRACDTAKVVIPGN